MDLPLLFENTECAVVNKPAGVAVLAQAGSALPSLAERFPDWRPVHRLDNDTSGCLLLAKTDAAYERLRARWQGTEVQKTYLAIVHGLASAGVIDIPIAHHPRKNNRMIAVPNPQVPHRGQPRPATTTVRVLAHYHPTHHRPEPLTLVEAGITSGARHQIRVHLAHHGWPIVGDRLYGKPTHTLTHERHLLHAHRLVLPSEGIDITAPLTPDWIHFCSLWGIVVM